LHFGLICIERKRKLQKKNHPELFNEKDKKSSASTDDDKIRELKCKMMTNAILSLIRQVSEMTEKYRPVHKDSRPLPHHHKLNKQHKETLKKEKEGKIGEDDRIGKGIEGKGQETKQNKEQEQNETEEKYDFDRADDHSLNLLNFVVTDGEIVVASRFTSGLLENAHTLFYCQGKDFDSKDGEPRITYHRDNDHSKDMVIISSEPLTHEDQKDFTPVTPNHIISFISTEKFYTTPITFE